ncbi:MAG: lactate utilization protein [Candidatus Methanomethyliaceae archaeon]|nr:lactate utilization protein [Candidatus Methanomethyliaceae archaeon]MDW7971531.1 lactate utilization protein B [Nitrososphaerota archaeon]
MDIYSMKREEFLKWLKDENRRRGLSRAVSSYVSSKEKILARMPHINVIRKEARKIKENSMERIFELLKEAMDNIIDSHGNAYFAKNAEEAREIVLKLIGSNKMVIKSKSLVSEEIELNEFLEKYDNKVFETDLGEFIIQLRGEKPTHIINPSVHVPREEVAKTFSKIIGREVKSDIEELVKVAREYLRDKFFTADVGITGANVVAANTGTIFIIENEGNARFVSNAPPIHICITGMEKIVPTLEDAFKIVQVLPPYATAIPMSAYVSMITSPSRTADIEKTLVYGVHGPRELHVIFLDNGRTRMLSDSILKEALYCIRCGSCMYECPVYRIIGGAFGHNYFGGIGIIWSAFTAGEDKVAAAIDACTKCGRCKELCPLEIDVPKMVEYLKKKLVSMGYIAERHKEIRRNIIERGNPFGE